RLELLHRVPDLADAEAAARVEGDVIVEPVGRKLTRPLDAGHRVVVLLGGHARPSGKADKDAHSVPPWFGCGEPTPVRSPVGVRCAIPGTRRMSLRYGTSTNLTPSAARERAKRRSKSASSATPVISGSSWIAPPASRRSARCQATGFAAKPERTRSSLKQISSKGTVTGAPRSPICTTVPPRETTSSAVAIAGSAPEHSMTTSGALPGKGRSALDVSKPRLRASLSRASSVAAPR